MEKKEYVVFCEDDGTYWCGLNTWDKQLRKAKVFHSLKYANEVAERYKELKLRNVEVRIELVPEAATYADRIRAMSDEELAKFICEWCNCVPGYCPGVEMCTPSLGKANGLVKWLQQPAEEG